MEYRLTHDTREWDRPAPAPPAAGDTGGALSVADFPSDDREAAPAAVFPAPLTTIIAAALGGLIGLAMVYGVATRLAETLAGVGLIVLAFALTMVGPRVHAAARTETGRTIAVVLEAIAFGGAIGALIVLI